MNKDKIESVVWNALLTLNEKERGYREIISWNGEIIDDLEIIINSVVNKEDESSYYKSNISVEIERIINNIKKIKEELEELLKSDYVKAIDYRITEELEIKNVNDYGFREKVINNINEDIEECEKIINDFYKKR